MELKNAFFIGLGVGIVDLSFYFVILLYCLGQYLISLGTCRKSLNICAILAIFPLSQNFSFIDFVYAAKGNSLFNCKTK